MWLTDDTWKSFAANKKKEGQALVALFRTGETIFKIWKILASLHTDDKDPFENK